MREASPLPVNNTVYKPCRTIYVYWEKELAGSAEQRAFVSGIQNALNIFETTRAHLMPEDRVVIIGECTELDTFVQEQAKTASGFVDAESVVEKLHEMVQNDDRKTAIYLTDEPLTSSKGYLVGLTRGASGIVVSTHRFRNMSRNVVEKSIELCTMHELGHAHGVVTNGRVNSIPNDYHCSDFRCVMNPIPGGDFRPLIADHHGSWFCPVCLEAARQTNLRCREIDRIESRRQQNRQSTTSAPTTQSPPPLPPRAKTPPPLPARRSRRSL